MVSLQQHFRPSAPRFCWWRSVRFTFVLVVGTFTLACSTTQPSSARLVADLAPLQLRNSSVSVGDVQTRVPATDLLATDERMRTFVQRYTQDIRDDRTRLMMLHRAIKGVATMGVQYDPQADGTAKEAFYRGSANCLTYASLFIALAREAGLDAGYQWLKVAPQWTKDHERIIVRLHVNAAVSINKREQYMVDIDPLEPRDIASSRTISDTDALALHHSNIAMKALAKGHIEQAWLHGVRALQFSPDTPHLWVNLGVIYRFNGQHDAAEHTYLQALSLDPQERSAMNNLVVLYGLEGRNAERAVWQLRIARHRKNNPYYHAWLGENAAAVNNWQQATQHFQRALKLSPGDSRLLFALGRSYQQLGQNAEAVAYLTRAIAAAPTRQDRASYQMQLNTIGAQQLPAQGSMRM